MFGFKKKVDEIETVPAQQLWDLQDYVKQLEREIQTVRKQHEPLMEAIETFKSDCFAYFPNTIKFIASSNKDAEDAIIEPRECHKIFLHDRLRAVAEKAYREYYNQYRGNYE